MEALDTTQFLSVLASRPLAPLSAGAYDFLSAQAGDYYIASQAQLMQISRDFIRSVDAMRLEAEVSDAEDMSMAATVMDLNQRLDQWCRSWVWSVSLGGRIDRARDDRRLNPNAQCRMRRTLLSYTDPVATPSYAVTTSGSV